MSPEYLKARGFCHRLTGDPNDGDDLLQDALVRALSGFAGLKNPAAFRGWLYRIIINTFHSHARRPWFKRLLPLTDDVAERVNGDDPRPRHAARRRLQVAMAALSPPRKSPDRALRTGRMESG